MNKVLSMLLLVVLIVGLMVSPTIAQEQVPGSVIPGDVEYNEGHVDSSELPQGCEEVPAEFHHTLGWSKYWPQLIESGTVKTWKVTGDIIAFIRIGECGGRYLIAIWRGGEWNTHFLANWGYVQSQIASYTATSWAKVVVQRLYMVVYFPCPGTWDRLPPCPTGTFSILPFVTGGNSTR